MPVALTVLVAKLASLASRWTGRGGGSALPGLVAEKLDPRLLAKLGRRLTQGSYLITGTNGKTTATSMLVELMRSQGQAVVTNQSGSNLTRGILSSLISQVNLGGQPGAQLGVFEVDEASLPATAAALRPKAILVLNLFRDQLDRYGELDKTAAMIGQAISGLPAGAGVLLNADDPLVASLAKYATPGVEVAYFGVQDSPVRRLEHDFAADSSHCPNDGLALDYTMNFFGHIGHYRCPAGDFERPQPQFELSSEQTVEGREGEEVNARSTVYSLQSTRDQENYALHLPLQGLYNAYNALGVVAMASRLGISINEACRALERVTAAFGRAETFEYDGRRVQMFLIKNPTGFNQVIQTHFRSGQRVEGKEGNDSLTHTPHSSPPTANLMIAINDNFADGRDVSWLWDVGFEELTGSEQGVEGREGRGQALTPHSSLPTTIVASGIRAADLALRLKYAGIPSVVEPDLLAAFHKTINQAPPGSTVTVLPTYTAMLALRQLLRRPRFET